MNGNSLERRDIHMSEANTDSSAVTSPDKTTSLKGTRRGLIKAAVATTLGGVLAPLAKTFAPLIPGTNQGSTAEASTDHDGNAIENFPVSGPMLETYQKYGGASVWGPAISQPFPDKKGRLTQIFHKGAFQLTLNPDGSLAKPAELWNIYDDLAAAGVNLDNNTDLVPNSADWRSDNSKVWNHNRLPAAGSIEDNHVKSVITPLDNIYPQLLKTYFANPYWFEQYGLPMSAKDYGNVVAVRCQRTILQLWKDKTPWTDYPGQVVLSNAGLDAKKYARQLDLDPAIFQPHALGNPVVEIKAVQSTELLSQQDFLQQMQVYIETTPGRKDFINQFKDRMLGIANSLKKGPGRIIPSEKYPQYTFARDGFWALMTLQDKGFTQQVVDRFKTDQAKNPDGHFATALLNNDSIPYKRDRDEESTMMGVLAQFLLHKLGGNVDTNSLSRAYSFIQSHIQNGEYVTNGDPHPEEAGTYHYWADTLRNPRGSVITYNQGLLCVTLNALQKMGVSVDGNLIAQAENRYRDLASPVLTQRKNSTTIDTSAIVGEALAEKWFDKSILGRDKVLATYNHITNNPSKVMRGGRFTGFKVISSFQGGYLSQAEFNDAIDTPGNYQNGGTWMLYDELLLYAAIRQGAGNQAKELFLQRLESEGLGSHEFMSTTPGMEGTSDQSRDNYGWNTFIANLLP